MKITGSMKIAGSIKNQAVPDPNLYLFDFDKYPPSIANLPPALTINGSTVYPTFRYKGGDAGSTIWKPWGYGQPLTLQAGTAPTYNAGSPLLGNIDDSVYGNGGGYYKSGNTNFANIATDDVVFEVLYKIPTIRGCLASKRESSVKNGWFVDSYAAGSGDGLKFRLSKDDGTTATIISNNLTEQSWIFAQCFVDRSGSGQWYLNGVASGAAVDVTSCNSNIDNSIAFCLLVLESATIPWYDSLSYLALWLKDSWLDTHLQATVAAERFYRLTGVYPHQAKGTALPSVCTRNSASYLDKIEPNGTTKLYYVGAGWPRSCSRVDSNGKTVKGFLDEASIQNLFLQTQTFGSTSWIKQNSSVTADSIVSPDGTMTADIIVENGVNSGHGVLPAINVDVGNVGQNIVYSVYAKAINQNYMYFNSQCAMDQSAAFDLTNGNSKVSNSTYIPNYGTIYCGNGWYRCWISFPVWRENWFFAFYSCSTYGWTGYQGTLGVQAISLWGAQAELGSYPSSYIPTTTVAVTRAADALRYNGNNVTASKGTLSYNLLLPSYDLATSCVAVSLSAPPNLCLQSQDFHTTWATDGTLTVNNTTTTTAPDGTTTGYSCLNEGSANSNHYVYQNITRTSGIVYTWSCYAKAINRTGLYASIGTAEVKATFNLSTGASQVTVGTATVGMTAYSNGWYRCYLTYTSAGGITDQLFIQKTPGGASTSYQGESLDGIYLWGAQCELGSTPTSYCATTTASTANRITSGISATGDASELYIYGQTAQADVIGTTDLVSNTYRTIKHQWSTNNAKVYVDGTSEGTPDTSCSIPTGIDRIDLSDYNGANQINGLINNLKILPVAVKS